MMRLEMIEGQDVYEGKFQQTERKLHVVDGDEDYHPQNNFTWTFVSLTEEGVNLKVDFDEPTAVSRTPTAKNHIAVTFMSGDWLLGSESALFVEDGTTF